MESEDPRHVRLLFRNRTQTQAADFLRAAAEAEAESQGEVDVIRACRELAGPAPRPLPAPGDVRSRLALTPEVEELFAGTGDEMLKILEDQETLLGRGEVVWGQLVQANSVLFDAENPHPLPANAVSSLDPFFDGRLSVLASIAGGLFAQKNTTAADRELREFVRVVTDERERILRKELPRGYCSGRSVYFPACFVQPGLLADYQASSCTKS